MENIMLRAEGISVSYGNNKIINNLNIDIKKKSILSIIGPNGSGKTTLLRALSRNIKLDGGRVFLDGKDMHSMKNKETAREMAVLSQNNVCPLDMKVRDLVSYGRFSHREWWKGNSEKDKDIIDWAIKRTGIQHLSRRKIHTLSGGERQRTWIAMALAQKPKVLLLDEPTTYLDICHQIELLELVNSLNKEEGITVIMVLHDINQAARYSHELVIIEKGKIIKKGCPNDVINKDTLKKSFRINADVFIHQESKKPFFYASSVV